MNPLLILINILKPLLYPISLLYGIIIWLRNKLYDTKWFSSIQFNLPVITVGNLSTGGTGKTPHIEYLVRLLEYQYQVATMSRGYKRLTTGFYLANEKTDAAEIGDEPMQFHRKFPQLEVSVCEDRVTGIPRLLSERPNIEVILLDDAFQHRSVKPGLNILISDYSKPFYNDYILPFGSLREGRKAYHRADIIIVSKCPPDLSIEAQNVIISKLKPLSHQSVYFSKIAYGSMTDFFTGERIAFTSKPNVIMVSGIAKPQPMLDHLRTIADEVHLLRYPDHHFFSDANLEEMRQTYLNWDKPNKIIVTTEKDSARLEMHKQELLKWNIGIAVLPIQIEFLLKQEVFNAQITNYIYRERLEMEMD
jgi:tetraacyldisaccharide 4'-kinase